MTPDGKFKYRGVLQSDHLDFFYDDRQVRVDIPVALESLVRQGREGAQSLADLIREKFPGDLSSGTLLIEIPALWGSFSIATPHPAALISDPLILCRELELNAPDLPTAYHLDYHSETGGTLILALRSIVVEFLKELFKPLGLEPAAVRFKDQHEESQMFDLKRSRAWGDLLAATRQKPRRWPKVVLLVTLPLLVVGVFLLWSDRFTPEDFKNEPSQIIDTSQQPGEESRSALTAADSSRGEHALSIREAPVVSISDRSPDDDPVPATTSVEVNLAQRLLEMVAYDTLDYIAVLPGWMTWRTAEGQFDSLSFSTDLEMPSFQHLEQSLLSYDDLIDMLNGNELDSAAKIVLLRDGEQFNLLWYH